MARGRIREDSAISIKPISVTGTRQIVKLAFDYAIANGRKSVTAVCKANIMKFTGRPCSTRSQARWPGLTGPEFERQELGDGRARPDVPVNTGARNPLPGAAS